MFGNVCAKLNNNFAHPNTCTHPGAKECVQSLCSAGAAKNPHALTVFKIQIEHEMSTNLVKLTFCKMTRVRRKLLSLLMLKGAECVALELR